MIVRPPYGCSEAGPAARLGLIPTCKMSNNNNSNNNNNNNNNIDDTNNSSNDSKSNTSNK